jgi:hypothetical protein
MPTQKGGNSQMYNIQGLITPGGYTHTVAANEILSPVFAGQRGGAAAKKKPKPKAKSKKPNSKK